MILITKELKYTTDDIIIESDVALDTTIDGANFALQMYNDNGTVESVSLSASVVIDTPKICTIKTELLQNNKIYSLTAFGISNADHTETISAQVFRFLSVDRPILYNTNNVYTQLNDISKVLSVEYLLKNQEDYTLEFKPSTYNFESGTYDYSNELVTIQNNKKMLDLFIGQYFTEYKTFYDAINKRLSKTKYDDTYINNIHLMFMNNIAKWYSLKGNKTFIEVMVNLYAKYLGYNVLSVVEDPEHNFIYRVSTSIPEIEWNRYIKPFVHPMGWNDIYNEVTSIIDGFYFQQVDLKRRAKESWAMDCISYLDAEAYSDQMVPHFRRIKNIYHHAGNIESFSVTAHEHHLPVSFQQVHDEYKFGMNLNVHTTGVDYHQQELYKVLKDKKNIKYHIDRFNKTLTVDFGLPGVANEYLYKHFTGNTISDITESLLSKVTVDFDHKEIVLLKLKKNEWQQDISRIDDMMFECKHLPYSFALNNTKKKLLGIRNDDKKAYQYNGIAIRDFASDSNCNTLGYTKDFQYTYAISGAAVSASFKSEFDTSSSFAVSGSLFTYGGSAYKNTTVKYNKVGFNKYVWKLYTNSTLVQERVTFFNDVSFNILNSDYATSNIELTIYYKNGSYKLNNKAVCV